MNKNDSRQSYINIVRILTNTLMCTFLYNVAVFMPILGFLLLVYKIKNVSFLNKKRWIIVNLLTMFLIGGFTIYITPENSLAYKFLDPESLKNLAGYILIFLPIELLYYFFNRGKKLIPVFDRIMITGLITTVATCFYLKMLNIDFDVLKEAVQGIGSFDKATTAYILNQVKNNVFYLVYTYVGLIIYLTYYSFGKKSYPRWRISYQWLILYIVPFYFVRFGHVENIYLTNMMQIIKISFVVYGLKILYNLMRTKIKSDIICHILAVLVGFNFQNITFIIAGLLSFEAIKITIIRNNGGK